MLIVAIPKSTSTSLMSTLGQVYQRPATQDYLNEQPVPEGYSVIVRYHSDMRLITDEQARRWSGADAFFKQHVVPVDENREKLRGTKIVLLLRDPEEIVLAYRRAELARLHPERPEFAGCSTQQQWLNQAVRCGLLQDLQHWTQNWLDDPGQKLVIQQRELVANPDKVVAAIADFWGLPHPQKSVELAYERYSRVGSSGPVTSSLKRLVQIFKKSMPPGVRSAGKYAVTRLRRTVSGR
jgi:hypothetical protein